jgi:hypothetical protein
MAMTQCRHRLTPARRSGLISAGMTDSMQRLARNGWRLAAGGGALAAAVLAAPANDPGRPEAPADRAAPAAVVWTLDRLDQIAGCVPEVLGAPRLTEDGRAARFNGVDEGIVVPVNPIAGWAQFTIEALIEPAAGGAPEQRFLHFEDERGNRGLLELRLLEDGRWCLDAFLLSGDRRLALIDRTLLHPAGRWHWVALRYDGRRMASFVNGKAELEGEIAVAPMAAGRTSLGVRLNRISWFKGAIREVRFHAAALAPDRLQRAP